MDLHRAIVNYFPRNTWTDRERVLFETGFRAGWKARTTNAGAVMVTREYLADLERRVMISEKRAFPPRPDGSVS
jgi:hypothetical protein